MSRTEQAVEVARRAVERKVWTEDVAFKFVVMAESMTQDQFDAWADASSRED